ncbi:MAG: hypothetical protein ABPD24_00790 [Candidatus Shikimatogenerans sp. AspAUS03]|uniref:Uncharacterized protein n=1 Tax=Candidatus Shikimatogenerans sp. AspAUS03 TaxID=3158563 RepID=A0AAU7QSQ5_9FLAO
MFSKLLKLDNFKKNLKYLFYINLIDKKLSYIFSLYNYKYLINYKFNYLYKKYYILKQKVNIIYKKKYNK